MTLLTPAGLLLAVVAVPIVLMYILRLRRPERPISSILLWPHIVGDMQANAPWQRLRPSMLLVLQLLAVLGLVAALARPALSRNAVVSKDVIVILDQSFSMRATDAAPSRFAAARARARSLASNLAPGNVMSVIGMSRQPHLAIAESSDRTALDHALDALSPESSTPNALAALSLASSLARQGERTEAVLFTDHSSGIRALPLSVPFPVQVVRLGGIRRDLGIASFSATGGTTTQAIVRVRNFGHSPVSSDLNLYADGNLADVRTLTVPPGGEDTETWDSLPAGIRRLRAHLDVSDDMTADKTAWAVVASAQHRRVLLVTRSGYFLRTALSLQPGVETRAVSPALYSPSGADRFDVVVFDGVLPRTLPRTAVLLVGPPSGRLGSLRIGRLRPTGGATLGPPPSEMNVSLLRYVDFSDVHVARVRESRLPSSLHPLVVAGRVPIIVSGQMGDSRVALVTFRIDESDWPLRVSFPIAMRNLLDFLAPSTVVGSAEVASGSSVVLIPPAATREIRVIEPDGEIKQLGAPFPPFTDTRRPGIYRVQTVPGSSEVTFAVNYFSYRTPDEAGPHSLRLGHESAGTTRTVPNSLGIEWAFSVVVLGLLAVEWWAAFKR